MNLVIITGHLGHDPEFKETKGDPVANLSIATTEKWTKDGEKHSKTEWHRVVLWGKQAELANQYLKKGNQVTIQGKIQTRDYEKDGVKKYITEIVGQRIEFLGGKPKDSDEKGTVDEVLPPSDDDNLPF